MVVVYIDDIPVELANFYRDGPSVQEATYRAMHFLKRGDDDKDLVPPSQFRVVPSGAPVHTKNIMPEDVGVYVIERHGWVSALRNLNEREREYIKNQHLLQKRISEDSVNSKEEDAENKSDMQLPKVLDLPAGVITSIEQLRESELRPSIFGGIPDEMLIEHKAIEKCDVDDLHWIKTQLNRNRGIQFSKCSRKVVIEPRTLISNPTFTIFECKCKEDVRNKVFFKSGGSKKFATSDIVTLVKGKASPELEQTSSTISPHNCLCLAFTNRSLSMIFSSMSERDRVCRGLASLLAKPVVEQDFIL